MFLQIVYTSPVFGEMDTFIGPFKSKKERHEFRQAWLRIVGYPGAIMANHEKRPKRKTVMPVAYIKQFLALHEKVNQPKKKEEEE